MPTINQLIRKGRRKVIGEVEVTGAGRLSATARRMRAGDDAHTEEAEFCAAQSGKSAVDEWPGSDCLHSWRGA